MPGFNENFNVDVRHLLIYLFPETIIIKPKQSKAKQYTNEFAAKQTIKLLRLKLLFVEIAIANDVKKMMKTENRAEEDTRKKDKYAHR